MARFECTNHSVAEVPATRERIWAVVTSPERLAALTPMITAIAADGDRWTWRLQTISALGVSIRPAFTERMTFVEGRRLTYRHDPPPGSSERAGARGTYDLSDLPDGGTRLEVDITLHVELPLPRAARPAVERVMAGLMDRTGQRFADNLYAELGLPGPAAPRPVGR